jgi:fumarate reductase subunit C
MSPQTSQFLWRAQRSTAHVLGLLVLVHLGLMVVAVQGGLTAGEILQRTQGAVGWLLFYASFVVLVSIHAPIGLKNILHEQLGLTQDKALKISAAYGVLLLALGLRACWAVFTGGPV